MRIKIVGGSDWNVSSADPLAAIEVALRRQDPLTDAGPVSMSVSGSHFQVCSVPTPMTKELLVLPPLKGTGALIHDSFAGDRVVKLQGNGVQQQTTGHGVGLWRTIQIATQNRVSNFAAM